MTRCGPCLRGERCRSFERCTPEKGPLVAAFLGPVVVLLVGKRGAGGIVNAGWSMEATCNCGFYGSTPHVPQGSFDKIDDKRFQVDIFVHSACTDYTGNMCRYFYHVVGDRSQHRAIYGRQIITTLR